MHEQLDLMYREIILDHYKSPRGTRPLQSHDLSAEGFNPSCGDEIVVDAATSGEVIGDISVRCKGCAISVASGSMLAESVKGLSVEQANALATQVKQMLTGEAYHLPVESDDLAALQGVRQFPVRIKCALLAWMTLLDALAAGTNRNQKQPTSTETDREQ